MQMSHQISEEDFGKCLTPGGGGRLSRCLKSKLEFEGNWRFYCNFH